MRFYVNENFPLQVVTCLRLFGHDVLTSFEAGQANQSIPDIDVLNFSIQEERVLLTLNKRDFIRLHQEKSQHWGIIVCSVFKDHQILANQIHNKISNIDSMKNQLLRINRS